MYSTCLWVDFITLSYVIFLENKCLTVCPNKVSLQKRARQRTNSCNIQQLIGYKTYGGLLHFTCTKFRAYRALQTINSLNLSIKIEPIAEGTDADVWFLNWIYTYCVQTKSCDMLGFWKFLLLC